MNSSAVLPADARRSLFIYNLLFPIALLAMLPGLLRRMLRRGNFRENFGQRLARYGAGECARFAEGEWVWIHSISVGETLIALKLARELRRQNPALQVAISVTTSTGFALARQSLEPWLETIYNPLDASAFVRTALDTLCPRRVIFIEGEAWPNLVAECRRRGIPTALVNARLSPRSEGRFRRFRRWTGPIFRLVDLVCVPEVEDIARWESIGVPAEKVRHTGSMKFDLAASVAESRAGEFRALLAASDIAPDAPLIVGGSTWAPEEFALGEHLLELRRDFPSLLLILVPRHIERTAEILRQLAPLGLRIARRTALPSAEPFDILLVDTTGELRDWYALATVAFVGKSLPGVSDTGGQNPAEPAALGKPTLFGPHMENFISIAAHLLATQAAAQVPSAAALLPSLRALLASPAERAEMSTRARTALLPHQNATTRTAALLT